MNGHETLVFTFKGLDNKVKGTLKSLLALLKDVMLLSTHPWHFITILKPIYFFLLNKESLFLLFFWHVQVGFFSLSWVGSNWMLVYVTWTNQSNKVFHCLWGTLHIISFWSSWAYPPKHKGNVSMPHKKYSLVFLEIRLRPQEFN